MGQSNDQPAKLQANRMIEPREVIQHGGILVQLANDSLFKFTQTIYFFVFDQQFRQKRIDTNSLFLV